MANTPTPAVDPESAVPMPEIVIYPHHFANPEPNVVEVAVFKELQGTHRSRCLCWFCKKFIPENRETNCPIANKLFTICVDESIVTPVAECRADTFEQRDEPHPWFSKRG